jgi:hypothetical protein
MKKLSIVALSVLILGFGSCNTSQSANAQNSVTISQAPASDIDVPGFNVDEFANLLKVTKDPSTSSQRSFQTRSTAAPVRSGGFGSSR